MIFVKSDIVDVFLYEIYIIKRTDIYNFKKGNLKTLFFGNMINQKQIVCLLFFLYY